MTKNTSYWLDLPYSPRPALGADIEADIAIVGGGITGVSAAYHCAKRGFKTVLVEKETIASGSAGKNSGMVVDGLAIDFIEAVDQFGADAAKEIWQRTVEAREHVISLIQEHGIDCELVEKTGSLYISRTEEGLKWLRQEAAGRQEAGIHCELKTAGDQLRGSPITAAILNPEDCTLHPVKFVRGLAAAAEQYGAVLYDHSPASAFDEHTVTTSRGTITASKVVLALESTNPYITKSETFMERHQAIATNALSEKVLAGLDWQYGGMFWTLGSDYMSARTTNNRLLISDTISLDTTAQELEQEKQKLLGKLMKFFPSLAKVGISVDYHWTGLLVFPHNARPHIAKQNGCYAVFGQGGNGLTNGIMTGKMLADHFAGAEIPALYQSA